MADILTLSQPARRSRIWTVLLGIVAIIVIAALAGGFYLIRRGMRVEAHFERGGEHFDRAVVITKKTTDRVSDLTIRSRPEDAKAAADAALKGLPDARRELHRAAEAFAAMRGAAVTGWELEVARLSLDAVREARQGTSDTERLLERLEVLSQVMVRVKSGVDKFNQAFARNNDAVTRSNGDRYAEGKQNAQLALALFAEARTEIEAADALDSTLGLGNYLAQIIKGEEWARNALRMAELGETKKFDDYNKSVALNNQLDDEVIRLAQDGVIIDPEGWLRRRLGSLTSDVERRFDEADELRRRALKLWNENI